MPAVSSRAAVESDGRGCSDYVMTHTETRRHGEKKMTENEIGEIVVDCAVKMHKRLGPGLLESVYETVLCYELHNRGRSIQRQVPVPITYDNMLFTEGFRADLIIDGKVRARATITTHFRTPIHPVRLCCGKGCVGWLCAPFRALPVGRLNARKPAVIIARALRSHPSITSRSCLPCRPSSALRLRLHRPCYAPFAAP